jgi:hypothetical protein
MKIHFNVRVRQAHLLVVGLLFSSLACAFTILSFTAPYIGTILHGDANHEAITRKALLSNFSTTIASGEISFTMDAAETIVSSNSETDSAMWDTPFIHFDDETFVQANNHLALLRIAIANQAIARDYFGAQKNLGLALHTVQDFYSHSTWVEAHTGNEQSLATLGNALPAGVNLSTIDMVLPCTVTGLIDNPPITTGFFTTSQAGISPSYIYSTPKILISDQGAPYKAGKCTHGTSGKANTDLLGKGINKDSELRTNYGAAFNSAVRATDQYVNEVINEMRKKNATDANVCGLLGVINNKACATILTAILPKDFCPGKIIGISTNPVDNTNIPLNNTFDIQSCMGNSVAGTRTATRILNGFRQLIVSKFSGNFTTDGKLILISEYPTIFSAPGFRPCLDVKTVLTVDNENNLIGRWTSNDCTQGGDIVARLHSGL